MILTEYPKTMVFEINPPKKPPKTSSIIQCSMNNEVFYYGLSFETFEQYKYANIGIFYAVSSKQNLT